jgi:hypothetical protein
MIVNKYEVALDFFQNLYKKSHPIFLKLKETHPCL